MGYIISRNHFVRRRWISVIEKFIKQTMHNRFVFLGGLGTVSFYELTAGFQKGKETIVSVMQAPQVLL
jgi:hypothetical protein